MPFIRQAIDKRGVFVQRINPASNETYLDIEAKPQRNEIGERETTIELKSIET